VSRLADVFRALNRLRDEGVILEYAIGGATAVLFYAEPTRTYDIDVFVNLRSAHGSRLVSLAPVYDWARAQGVVIDGEHLMLAGVPVQLLPAFTPLVDESIVTARVHEYEGVAVRVVGPEHLVALALQAGGARRRERAWQLIQSGTVDRETLSALLAAHGIEAEIPDDL